MQTEMAIPLKWRTDQATWQELEPFNRGALLVHKARQKLKANKKPASVHAGLCYFVIENDNYVHFGGDERT